MRVPSFILTGLCATIAQARPQPTTLSVVQVETVPLAAPKPASALQTELPTTSLEKRANWCSKGSDYNQADADELQRQLQNINPNQMTYLPAWSTGGWIYGTAKVCLINQYLSDNTHVKRWEAGWGMGYIKNMCCSGKSRCSGGNCSGHGDSGLAVEIRVQNSARSCTI
ncbi:uncharacterized protein CTRU02_208321 [Colletotrichum truncatum]|uniref:Uncharacterized protein n=1 Tax=Colletotrichum truncatum TaxID=5467 RepID=A0ACC3YVY7_COLTU|nr:uncharacterized protein CTRU02_07499 [Colletotrichum truncatum]KAF6791159.1 hypothetical protein CTRU02_07499 [Colletotrichum truncatum]